jgi:hypothetical protein
MTQVKGKGKKLFQFNINQEKDEVTVLISDSQASKDGEIIKE